MAATNWIQRTFGRREDEPVRAWEWALTVAVTVVAVTLAARDGMWFTVVTFVTLLLIQVGRYRQRARRTGTGWVVTGDPGRAGG